MKKCTQKLDTSEQTDSHSLKIMFLIKFLFHFLPLALLLILSIDAEEAQRKLKILAYSPLNAWSHMQYMGKIADTLAEVGHEVHFLKFVHDPVIGMLNETKLVRKVIIVNAQHSVDIDLNMFEPIRNPFGGNGFPLITALKDDFKDFSKVFINICKEMTGNSALLDQLASEHYDVAIAEHYDFCAFGLFHRIRVHTKLAALAVPLFQMSAVNFGIPTFSSYVPSMPSPPMNAPFMSFLERIQNFINTFYEWAYTSDKLTKAEEPIFLDAFGHDFPSAKQIIKSITLVFVNSNPFFEFPRPTSNKIVHIGGLVDSKVGKLDQRTESILSTSKSGAVLVSFGSIADTTKMSVQMRRAFLRAFSRFPDYDFIWKLDPQASGSNDSALFVTTPNVHLFDWVPQTSILRHPKLRAFISHCGQNSVTEAARAGVPIVAIPLFGDQLYNAVMAKHKGVAEYLDVRKLHDECLGEELLVEALEKVLHTGPHRSNAQLVQKKLALTPFSPKERLVQWVQFAAEFPHLNELNLPTDDDLHWTVYYSVDVILFTMSLFAVAILALKSLLAMVIRRWIVNEEDKKIKKIQ